MVSKPTHRPIPIPLSVPAKEENQSFDSVDDLLSSIRELVSPGAVDIIDLNRPVKTDSTLSLPEPYAHEDSGSSEPMLSDSIRKSVYAEKWHLSEKALSDSANALSSLMNALERPLTECENPAPLPSSAPSEAPPSSHPMPDGMESSPGIRVEDLVAQCLKNPLDLWIQQNHSFISDHIKKMVDQHIAGLLHQWLDDHLPARIKASVDEHLDSLIQTVRKK